MVGCYTHQSLSQSPGDKREVVQLKTVFTCPCHTFTSAMSSPVATTSRKRSCDTRINVNGQIIASFSIRQIWKPHSHIRKHRDRGRKHLRLAELPLSPIFWQASGWFLLPDHCSRLSADLEIQAYTHGGSGLPHKG